MSVVKLMDFKLQTAFKTLEPSPAISHLLKFAFSPEKIEDTLNISVKCLTNNSLRKKVDSSAKAVYKKAGLKILIHLMSTIFLINSKRSKGSINKYADIGSTWRALYSFTQ